MPEPLFTANQQGHGPTADPTAADRFDTRLRLIGADVGAQSLQWYELVATPRLVVVEGSAGYYHEYPLKEIAEGLARAAAQRHTPEGRVPTAAPS